MGEPQLRAAAVDAVVRDDGSALIDAAQLRQLAPLTEPGSHLVLFVVVSGLRGVQAAPSWSPGDTTGQPLGAASPVGSALSRGAEAEASAPAAPAPGSPRRRSIRGALAGWPKVSWKDFEEASALAVSDAEDGVGDTGDEQPS